MNKVIQLSNQVKSINLDIDGMTCAACAARVERVLSKNNNVLAASVSFPLKSAIVDITNYVMIDINRPLHAYDADKIDKGIIVRNSKSGEEFTALDNKNYKLDDGMCVISDNKGVLGLGGIIGGTRSGTELDTKNILLESAYFDPTSIRKTAKKLNIDTEIHQSNMILKM